MIETKSIGTTAPRSSTTMRERLGLDCDGVLANFAVFTLARLNKDLGLALRVGDWRPVIEESPLSRRIGAAVFRMMKEDAMWAGLPPYPGTARRIAGLRERYDIYIVTAIEDRFAPVRNAWLERHGVQHEGLICVPRAEDKITIARDLGLVAFVEDLASTAVQMADAGLDSYLVRRPWNMDHPIDGTVRRGRWSQIVNWLAKRPATGERESGESR